MSRCSKTGYQDTEQYTGCIRSDHVRYCCEDDISKHQWVYSLSSFISDHDGSDISVGTCVKYVLDMITLILLTLSSDKMKDGWEARPECPILVRLPVLTQHMSTAE